MRSLLDGKVGLVPRAFLSIDPTPPPAPPHPTLPASVVKSDIEHDKKSSVMDTTSPYPPSSDLASSVRE